MREREKLFILVSPVYVYSYNNDVKPTSHLECLFTLKQFMKKMLDNYHLLDIRFVINVVVVVVPSGLYHISASDVRLRCRWYLRKDCVYGTRHYLAN